MKMPVPLGQQAPSTDQRGSNLPPLEQSQSWQNPRQPEESIEMPDFRVMKDTRKTTQESGGNDRVQAIQRMKAAQRNLLPSAELSENALPDGFPRKSLSPIPDAAEIERPRSALHSGDFRESQISPCKDGNQHISALEQSSPPCFWYAQSSPFELEQRRCLSAGKVPQSRSRAPSTGSLSSSVVLLPPTSPLVQSSNAELNISDNRFSGIGGASDKSTRRRTLPPESFRSLESFPLSQSQLNFPRPPPTRREHAFPYQAHQPRRSISSMHSFSATSNPQTPLSRSRRPSFSSDISPLHASMVGSFEESILRGRMSTNPSKPLDFIAKIGVLGRGDCSPKLHCPSHVTVPFSAVFYSYPELIGRRSLADDSPSPYVGSIDLEHNLDPPPRPKKLRKNQVEEGLEGDIHMPDALPSDKSSVNPSKERRKREKKIKRSRSPLMPFGGCYRIPKEGQLQIMIKTPNNTAVKLFLIPYSLEGMEPGSKTFIRQRSYSNGPIVESSETGKSSTSRLKTDGKPVLRYLIHLMICCPSKGRFYLYDHIRVVFANRVPDGKERLQNDVQFPDPKYAPYKPGRETPSSSGAKLAADLARRRSSAHAISPYYPGHSEMDMGDGFSSQPPIPFSLPTRPPDSNALRAHWAAVVATPVTDHWTPYSSTRSQASSRPEQTATAPTPSQQAEFYNPWLPPGDSSLASSGRNSGRATPEGVPRQYYRDGESSLLARQLKGLDVDMDSSAGRRWCGLGSQQMQ